MNCLVLHPFIPINLFTQGQKEFSQKLLQAAQSYKFCQNHTRDVKTPTKFFVFLNKVVLPLIYVSLEYLGSKNSSFYTGHESNHLVKFNKMVVTLEPTMQL